MCSNTLLHTISHALSHLSHFGIFWPIFGKYHHFSCLTVFTETGIVIGCTHLNFYKHFPALTNNFTEMLKNPKFCSLKSASFILRKECHLECAMHGYLIPVSSIIPGPALVPYITRMSGSHIRPCCACLLSKVTWWSQQSTMFFGFYCT